MVIPSLGLDFVLTAGSIQYFAILLPLFDSSICPFRACRVDHERLRFVSQSSSRRFALIGNQFEVALELLWILFSWLLSRAFENWCFCIRCIYPDLPKTFIDLEVWSLNFWWCMSEEQKYNPLRLYDVFQIISFISFLLFISQTALYELETLFGLGFDGAQDSWAQSER